MEQGEAAAFSRRLGGVLSYTTFAGWWFFTSLHLTTCSPSLPDKGVSKQASRKPREGTGARKLSLSKFLSKIFEQNFSLSKFPPDIAPLKEEAGRSCSLSPFGAEKEEEVGKKLREGECVWLTLHIAKRGSQGGVLRWGALCTLREGEGTAL